MFNKTPRVRVRPSNIDPLFLFTDSTAQYYYLHMQQICMSPKRGLCTAFTIIVNALNSMSVTRLSLPISEVIHVEIVKLEPHPSHFFMSYLLVLILLGFRNHILSQSGNEVNQWKTYFSSQTHYINTKRCQVHLGTYLHVTIIITCFSLSYDDNLNCLSLNLVCIMLHPRYI